MALVSVTARNNSASVVSVNDLGISFAAAEIKTLSTFFKFTELIQSNDLLTLATASTLSLSVDGGTTWLNQTQAINLLKVESEYEDLIQDASVNNVVSTDLKYCGVTTTAEWIIPNTTYTSIPLALAEYMNDSTVIEWLIGSPTRITVKQAGTYKISAAVWVRNNTSGGTTATNMASSYLRCIKNGSTVVMSEGYCHTYYLEVQQSYQEVVVSLAAGDYIEVQMYSQASFNVTLTECEFQVTRLEGVKGDTGPAGGTTVTIQDEGINIVTNTNVINFQGNAVTSTSGGTGIANVTINQVNPILKYIQVVDTAGNHDLNSSTTGYALPWDTEQFRDTDTFTHSTVTNPSRITVLVAGWYTVSFNLTYTLATQRTQIKANIRKNGATFLLPTSAYGYEYVTGLSQCSIPPVMIQLVANDYIELVSVRKLVAGTMNTTAGECSMMMVYIHP